MWQNLHSPLSDAGHIRHSYDEYTDVRYLLRSRWEPAQLRSVQTSHEPGASLKLSLGKTCSTHTHTHAHTHMLSHTWERTDLASVKSVLIVCFIPSGNTRSEQFATWDNTMSARQFSHISVINNKTQHYQSRPNAVKHILYSEQGKTLGCDPGPHEEWNSITVKHGTSFFFPVSSAGS